MKADEVVCKIKHPNFWETHKYPTSKDLAWQQLGRARQPSLTPDARFFPNFV